MSKVTQLGYLGLGVKSVDEWQSFSEDLLGVEAATRDNDGTLFLRMDDHHHRFALTEDAQDEVLYAGWQVDSAADLQAIATRLEQAGVAVTAATPEERERRRVADLIKFKDPDGLDVELFHGPELNGSTFESGRPDTGFVAGSQGLGHVVFAVQDLERAMTFYTEILGMNISDFITSGRMKLGFLHCNPRHHSLAFAEVPNAQKRTNHFMLQVDSLDAVGHVYDDVLGGAAPLLVSLGRHSNDEMVSFYAATPSNFGVEYGWGAREIHHPGWEVQTYDTTSSWGHDRLRTGAPAPRT